MADQLPINFAIPQESSIASYSWSDIADGTGFVLFYGVISRTGKGLINIWLPNDDQDPSAETNDFTGGDYDYDTSQFNSPRTIGGTAWITQGANADGVANLSIKAELFLVRGVTETSISAQQTSSSLNTTQPEAVTFQMPIAETNLQKGDKIRLTLTIYGGTIKIYTNSSLGLKLYLPFKINL